jgi:hypothetical protein
MVTGVTPAELSKHYPFLYHMAHRNSWAGIQRHGLLCTDALVDLFNVPPENRDQILNQQRKRSFPIESPEHGRAVIRDQKPLIRSRLEACLEGCTFQQWLKMLNSRVFFWLTEDRLKTLLCAREYCADQHVVLILDTERLATHLQNSITLAPINTGNTRPYPARRSLSTFSKMVDYPFQKRRRKVVELAVECGVERIMDYVVKVAEMRCSTCDKKEVQTIETLRILYP